MRNEGLTEAVSMCTHVAAAHTRAHAHTSLLLLNRSGHAARKRRHAIRTGHLLRNADPRGREARDCAARVIQRWWRGVMARAQVRDDLAAIRRIQAAWRGRVARFAYPALRRAWRRRNEAAIEVQRYVR